MIEYLRSHLGAKLFLSYLAIIFVGLAVLVAASQFALPSSFERHMSRMMGTPAVVPGGARHSSTTSRATSSPNHSASSFMLTVNR